MGSKVHSLATMRKFFPIPDLKTIQSWFPSHMFKGLIQMNSRLHDVDCILEVHDCRIPFSGRNKKLHENFNDIKPHLLLLNKVDCIEQEHKKNILNYYKRKGEDKNILFTQANKDKDSGVKNILDKTVEIIKSSARYSREHEADFNIMIVGIPNVGKSSIINKLRNQNLSKSNANPVGAKPGVTRHLLEKVKVSETPRIFLYDTPGISAPQIRNFEVSLKLALCNILPDKIASNILISDYLLFWLNKHRNYSYVDYLGIDKPTDNVNELLMKTCLFNKFYIKLKVPDAKGRNFNPSFEEASFHFVKGFRELKYGKILLDVDECI